MRFLHYSRKERAGIMVLVAAYLLLLVLPDYLEVFLPSPPVPIPEKAWWNIARKDSLIAGPDLSGRSSGNGGKTATADGTRDHFSNGRPFDPNTIGEQEWSFLGLPQRLINTIMHYRARGGRFRKADDLRRIYGMTDDIYRAIAPLVRIIDDSVGHEDRKIKGILPDEPGAPRVLSGNFRVEIIDINSADTGQWIALKGVGPVLARRIIRFREKLGGFYSIEQVAETYGLADSVFTVIKPRLSCSGKPLRKVRINSDSLSVLEQHPYIGRSIARQLLRYREQHGPFTGVETLSAVESLSPSWIDKIAPYLDYR